MKESTIVWDKVPVTLAATANPAPGADLAAITVPAGKKWLFLGGYCQFTCDANVANRYLIPDFLMDGTNSHFHTSHATAATASSSRHNSIGAHSIPGTLIVTTNMIPIPAPGIELSAGAVIDINLNGIQAGDDIGIFYYWYKELPL